MSPEDAANRAVELVIFDCDGVLIDSELISTRAAVSALAAIGYEIDEDEALRRFVGRTYAAMRRQVEADMGRPLPPSFNDDLERSTLEIMATDLQPIAGVGTALERLDLPRCVASSSSLAWIRQGLETTGLIDHFEPHLFSASMVEHGKPAPDIFLHAARAMGVAPTCAVVVEDSEAGVLAGVAAGAKVIGFTGGSHVVDSGHAVRLLELGAWRVIDDMAMLPRLLAEAN